jgi:hypothetical protein
MICRLPGCSLLLQRTVAAALRTRQLTSSAASTCVPVVIAGAGPTGLVLSSLLSQYGACRLHERGQPKAERPGRALCQQVHGVSLQASSTCC